MRKPEQLRRRSGGTRTPLSESARYGTAGPAAERRRRGRQPSQKASGDFTSHEKDYAGERLGYGGMGPSDAVVPSDDGRMDASIRNGIRARIDERRDVDASSVEVVVASRRVALRGTVDDRWMRHVIDEVAHSVEGVEQVRNRIRVRDQDKGPVVHG